jgi:hypothetical protein
MRKAIFPLIASLALCGAATGALVATNARAEQSPKRPVMMALATAPSFTMDTAAPPAEGGGPDMAPGAMPGMDMPMDKMAGHGAMRARMCKDMVARQTGELAYLESKLALTPAQAPLYARWKGVMLDIAQKHQGECAQMPMMHKGGTRPDMLEGMAMEEKMLKIRLADLQTERPTLSALFAALTPEQKSELGQAARHKMQGRMHMMMGMMDRPDGMGPGGMGPGGRMGHPPMDHGAPPPAN